MGSNWRVAALSEIGTIVGGATPSTKNPANWDGDIPWLTPKDLASYRYRYVMRGERNITDIGLASCSTTLLPRGAVLFSSRAPIGYIAIASRPICTNQGFKSVIPGDRIDPLFLYYLLLHNREKIESLGSGTTFKEVSVSVMKQVSVRFPESLHEQKAIAAFLDCIDSRIEINQRANDYLAA